MPPNIMIRVGADTSDAVRNLGNLDGPLGDVQTKSERMHGAVTRAALPAVAVLGALAVAGKGAAEAAAQDEAAQVALAGALTRTAGATTAQVGAAEAYISKLSLQTGIADDELRPALAKLASVTGDVGKAQSDLALAVDISAQSGKGLGAVSKALASAEDGHTASLAKLVPGLDAATLKSGNMAKITADLASKVGGAATEAAGTATGKYRVMQVQLGELQESIGAGLIPVISVATGLVLKMTTAASEHTTAVKIVIGVVAGLAAGVLLANAAIKLYTAGQVAVKVATAAWTAGQWLLNAALTANPVGIVVVAIAALTAGVILAYRNSETFRDAVAGVWNVLKNTNPILAVIGHFSQLVGIVKSAVDWISRVRFPDSVASAFSSLVGTVQSVVSWIGRIHFPSPPSWVGKLFGGSSNGGDFGAAPARAAVSAGAPRGAATGARPRGAGSNLLGLAGGGNGTTIIVYGATDPEGTARSIKRALRGHERRQGGLAAFANGAT